MKAIVQDRYGSLDALQLQDIERPTPADDEVLVRVRAASVHPDVWHVVSGRPYVLRFMGAGLRRPKNAVPGTDMAGRVESVGANVTRFQPGDEVFGETLGSYSWANGGAYAEYVSVREDRLALKPANLTFEQAAAVPSSAFIAFNAVRYQGQVQPGQQVLVNGAGGGVGIFAVQIARAYGAVVTGVDSPSKLDMLRSIGAERVIDYTREDFTRGDERYDLIVDIPGNHSLGECRRVLSPSGKYVLIDHDHFGASGGRLLGGLPRAMLLMAMSPFVSQLPKVNSPMPSKGEAMAVLKELIEAGKIMPVVDRTYPLGEVPEAIRYLAEEQTLGKVVITV